MNNNSCNYDSLSLLYCFVIKPIIDNLYLEHNLTIPDSLHNLSNIALKWQKDLYKKRILDLLKRNKIKYYDLKTNLLNFNKELCIKYNLT